MSADKKLLVVNCAALSWDLVQRFPPPQGAWDFQPLETVFPAVTCPVQASFRTGALPEVTGMVANGLYFPELRQVKFWEQSAGLVQGPRIWEAAREAGKTVGMMFWQQSLGEDVDLIVSPKPVHKHSGGLLQDCYTQPSDLYDRLVDRIGRPFSLFNYWGPLASAKSSEWITRATAEVMGMPDVAPDLLLTYLPHLDYDLQRFGPRHAKAQKAMAQLYHWLGQLSQAGKQNGYELIVFGDYAISEVSGAVVFPNQVLREAGLFHTRDLKGMAYPDFFASSAFAVVDHEVAHVFTKDAAARDRAADLLSGCAGVEEVISGTARQARGLDHTRSGDLVLTAQPGSWFAYPWWTAAAEAPDFAGHVDIHNKPGFDPCELFFGWPPTRIGTDPGRVKGTHGRNGPESRTAWSATFPLPEKPESLIALARAVQRMM